MLHHLRGDFRLALRRLVKTPAASLTVVSALSVGIGLCAVMFSSIDGVILPTPPFEAGDRVVRMWRSDASPVSMETYRYWEERQQSFDGFGLAEDLAVNLAVEGRATEPTRMAAISLSTLDLLAVDPVIGRPFAASDAVSGAPPVALIGYDAWRTGFDLDPGVLGQVIRLSGEPAEIIGVMPEGFGFPWSQEVWTPRPDAAFRPDWNPERLVIFGIVREGVSMEAAAAELNALDEQRPRPATEPTATPVEVRMFTDIINPAGRSHLLAGLMLGVAFLVLLVACANATNVLLACASVRSREVAVRSALGASRSRIAFQFWAEVSVLALTGAAGGAFLAAVGARLIRNAVGAVEGMPYWVDLRVDLPVLAFVSVAAVVAAVLAGVLPALFASRANRHELLKDASRGSSSRRLGPMMGRLIGAEMAVSLVLLVAAGLFVRSALNLQSYEFGFAPEGVYLSLVTPPEGRYDTPGGRAELAARLEEALGAIPEASSATVTTSVPAIGGIRRSAAVEGTHLPAEMGLPLVRYIAATPGFFRTFLAPVASGRPFDSRDRAGSPPVAIVSAAFEQEHLPEGAVGRRIALPEEAGQEEWLTVVGVVPDLLAPGIQAEGTRGVVYVPFAQAPPTRFQIAVRSRTTASVLAVPIRQAVATVDPDAALSFMRPMDDAIEQANAQYAWLSAGFLVAGGLALVLAAIGLYGVMAFWVTQRTREIGVRMAIGGGRGTILGFVFRQGMRPIVVGLGFGLLVALPFAWTLRGSLLRVAPFDPLVFGVVLGTLVGAGLFGCVLPALRATRVDPLTALSAE
ncbi:MAG: ADOP family duplicated permease [Gemmatimonadota bacterium]